MNWLRARTITAADLRHDGNCFTVLRWILASTVMISHAWDLTQGVGFLDPTVAILTFPVSRLAVWLFFTLSGFLVAGSLVKRGVPAFLQARALRLLPGLWVMLIVVPLGLQLAFGTRPWAEFLSAGDTWRFVLRNGALIGNAHVLPGIFTFLPNPAINGSLWTIPHEVRCYLALALIGGLGLLLPRWRFSLIILAGMLVHLALPEHLVPVLFDVRRLTFAFFLGVLAWLWRDHLRLSWLAAIAGVAGAMLLPGEFLLKVPAMQISFAYLALVAAFRVPQVIKAFSARIPDYSYGIYIYAFPMQQIALTLGADMPLINLAWGYALTVPAAALSWHLVEKPALRWKSAAMAPSPSKVSV